MDTSSHIPSKRPRLEANNEETERGITRCEELWYTDGSIVIEAEDTQFRVYKGILSSQSETFRDMFSIPQPPSAQHELVEGCPVVKVGDTAKDWKYVFLELFEKRYISAGSTPVAFDVVAGFLRLGDKYNIATLKKDAIMRLQYDFPSTLGGLGLDATDSMIKTNETTTTLARDAVNLAREVGCIDSILPWAFHVLGSHGIHKVVLEGTRSDGSRVSLSSADQAIIITGWANGLRQQRQTMKWAYRPGFNYCKDCSIEIFRVIRTAAMYNPVPELDGLKEWDELGFWREICLDCLSAAKASHTEGREAYWEELPTLYGLPEWHDLLKED